jgi:hypothetical protein
MEPDDKLAYYIEVGVVEIAGVGDNGDLIFKITDKAVDLAPELWDAHKEHVDGVLLDLFEKGLLNVSYNEDLEATIELTEEGKQVARENGLIDFEDDDN